MFVSLNVCLMRLENFVLPQLGIVFFGARQTPSPTLRVMPLVRKFRVKYLPLDHLILTKRRCYIPYAVTENLELLYFSPLSSVFRVLL